MCWQRWRMAVLAISPLAGAAVWGGSALTAKAATSKARASSSDADGSPATERKLKALEGKLDEVLANQQTILQKFDMVMEELRIIKVRATLRTGS